MGIYRYDFTTSSQLAINVICRRGWDVIIDSDHDLITNIFRLVICIVGLSNGDMSLILLDCTTIVGDMSFSPELLCIIK